MRRLLSTFLRIISIDTQAASQLSEPPVDAEALIDLALVMRERFWPDAGFGSDADRALACAALARCFPDYVTTVETCPCAPSKYGMDAEALCDECPTQAGMAEQDVRLSAFLSGLADLGVRPSIAVPAEVA